MKTRGQKLYEALNPKYIDVFEASDHFRERLMTVPNPRHIPDWNCLTKKCQDSYETLAVGHHLVPISASEASEHKKEE